MTTVRLPDGTLVSLDEPGLVEDTLKSAGSKFAEGALRTPFLASDLLNFGLDVTKAKLNPEWMKSDWYTDFRKYHKGSQWLDEGLGALDAEFYQPKTKLGKYVGAGAEGVGGALGGVGLSKVARDVPARLFMRPPPPANMETVLAAAKPAAAAGLAGGVASQGIQEVPGLENNPIASTSASILASALTALAMGRTPNSQKILFEGGQGVPPGDWRQAAANRNLLENTYSSSFTLGDIFPESNQLTGITKDASRLPGGAVLAQRLAQRNADLIAQGQAAKTSVAPAIQSADKVGYNAAAAAQDRIRQFEALRSDKFRELVQSASRLSTRDVNRLWDFMNIQALNRDISEPQRQAYRVLMETLTANDGRRFQTNLPAISENLKNQKMKTLSANAETAAKIDAKTFNTVYNELTDAIETLAPNFKKANSRYEKISNLLVDRAKQGPLGEVAKKNAGDNIPQADRVMKLIDGQSPQDIPPLMASIQKGAPNNPNLQQQIARSILDKVIPNQAPNAWDRVSRMAGVDPMASIEELSQSVGGNTQAMRQHLEANRLLQGTGKIPEPAGIPQLPPTPGQFVAQPSKSVGRLMGMKASETAVREISALLGNPTAENLARLREIVAMNPRIKASLLRAGLITANGTLVESPMNKE